MTFETRIRGSLEDGLARLDPGSGDLATVEQLGSRLRRRRRVTSAVVAAAVVAVVGGVAMVASDDDVDTKRLDPVSPSGTWQELSPAPLSPRWGAVPAWTGEEAIFVGGSVGTPCPPNATCTVADKFERDGAAYDPETDTWRAIAEAPIPVGSLFRPAVVGDTVVLFGNDRWLAYDAGEDSWRTIPGPERNVVDTGSISAVDGRVHALSQSGIVQVLDVATGTWSELPADDVDPRLDPGTVVATTDGVFLSGADPEHPGDGDQPGFTVVDAWDGASWTRLPVTEQVGVFRHWTGKRLVEPDIQTAPGLDGNPPQGGRLDPLTGQWSPLPNAPSIDADRGDGWSVVSAEGPLMAGWGYVFDDDAETWSLLGKPAETDVDVDQSAVWADGKLIVFGGLDEETGYENSKGLSNGTWVWTP
jgi:hypothetical protein